MKPLRYSVVAALFLLCTVFVYAVHAEEILSANANNYSVVIPQTLDFTIDPNQIFGRGQIFSEEHLLQNNGDTDILFSVSAAAVTLNNSYGGEPVSVTDEFHMLLNFSRDDIPSAVLTNTNDFPMSFVLPADGSAVYISVSGAITNIFGIHWEDPGVSLRLDFFIDYYEPLAEFEATSPAALYIEDIFFEEHIIPHEHNRTIHHFEAASPAALYLSSVSAASPAAFY